MKELVNHQLIKVMAKDRMNVSSGERYRVNVIHRGKERWKYCKTIKRARQLQQEAIANALHSSIFIKRYSDKKYTLY